MRKEYPSDISREQFEKISPLLESARKKTKPRTLDLYEIFCAALYVLKTGCQWRAMPSDFPHYRTVHNYFSIWKEERKGKENTLLQEILKKISWRGPTKTGTEIGDELFNRRRTKREKH